MWCVSITFHPPEKPWVAIRHYVVDSRRASVSYEAINAVVADYFPEDDGTKIVGTYAYMLPHGIGRCCGEVHP